MATKSFYVKESELDDFQVKIIKRRTDNSFVVKGCAGSGKSVLALWKAKQIQDEQKGSFLFIVYTKALQQYMLDGIEQIGINSGRISTYNKCFHWRKEDGEWIQGNWKFDGVDYIIVDEAQDFTKTQIETLKSKAQKALLLYGDTAQQLYKFKDDGERASIEDFAQSLALPMEQLVFNHRLPAVIARFAQYVSSVDDDIEARCKNPGSEKPKILEYPSFEKQLDAIADIIKNQNLSDVGIFVRNNQDVSRVGNYLTNCGINCEVKVNDNIELDFTSDNPKVMTYHSSKGLQFETVFLPDCSASQKDEQNPLYVALTRTYEKLFILHSGNLSPFFDVIPVDAYDTQLSSEEVELL